MSALTPISPKLTKLIPRLATDHDGEVVATVRAIDRALQGVGLDWHDLARALEPPPRPEVVFEHREPPQAGDSDWREMARWCRDHEQGELSPRERAFIADISRFAWAGSTPSEKQRAWLNAIHRRLYCGAGA